MNSIGTSVIEEGKNNVEKKSAERQLDLTEFFTEVDIH